SRTRDPRTDPCRVPSAPAPPGCRSPSACRSPPPPARSACLPASRSSQQLDDLPKRLRRDLAADTHPRAAAKLNLDKPSSLHPTPTRQVLRPRHDLDRHHRAALHFGGQLFRQYLPASFEQLVSVHIMPSRHQRHRRAKLQRLSHHLALVFFRPIPTPCRS